MVSCLVTCILIRGYHFDRRNRYHLHGKMLLSSVPLVARNDVVSDERKLMNNDLLGM